jgi:hypothetical protein
MFFQYKATAIGEGEPEIEAILEKEYKEDLSIEHLLEMNATPNAEDATVLPEFGNRRPTVTTEPRAVVISGATAPVVVRPGVGSLMPRYLEQVKMEPRSEDHLQFQTSTRRFGNPILAAATLDLSVFFTA